MLCGAFRARAFSVSGTLRTVQAGSSPVRSVQSAHGSLCLSLSLSLIIPFSLSLSLSFSLSFSLYLCFLSLVLLGRF
jgi:predicted membrane metal-binding protein